MKRLHISMGGLADKYTLFRYLWVIAVLPKTIQFVLLAALFIYVFAVNRDRVRLLKTSKLVFWVLLSNVVYAVSIVFNVLTGEGHETSRVFAAINTCLITFVAIGLFNYYLNTPIDIDVIQKCMYHNMLILAMIFVAFLLFGTKGNISYLNPLCGPDWLNGVYTIRFRGYLEYTNLVVFMYIFCLPYAFNQIKGKRFCIIVEVLSLFIITNTNSRIGILVCFVIVVLVLVTQSKKLFSVLFRKYLGITIIMSAIIIAVVLIIAQDRIQQLLEALLSIRQGSTATRLGIYSTSINRMFAESPVLGCGIKDLINGGFPYGSHSTYIGMFYKTGLLGGCIFLVFTVKAIITIIKRKTVTWIGFIQKVSFLGLFVAFAVEDLDGANWNIVIFYALFGVFLNQSKQECRTIDEKR